MPQVQNRLWTEWRKLETAREGTLRNRGYRCGARRWRLTGGRQGRGPAVAADVPALLTPAMMNAAESHVHAAADS